MNEPGIYFTDNHTPGSTRFGDLYYSMQGGLQESHYVFLQHNHLPRRFQTATQRPFTIMELGFGTGLNFLATWQAWRQTHPRCRLHYLALERYPLRGADMHTALARWPELAPLRDALLVRWPRAPCQRMQEVLEPGLTLSILFDDAREALSRMDSGDGGMIDSWYLDGFSPAKNPRMWRPEIFAQMARLSRAGAQFATYTAAGHVRRGLQTAGFDLHKDHGHGQKREMLCGKLLTRGAAPRRAPWFSLPPPIPRERALIIGAGLAGCATAFSLAQRGIEVCLIDQHHGPAMGASGNRAGVMYPRFTRDWSIPARISLAGFDLTHQYLHALELAGHPVRGKLNGVLEIATSPESALRLQAIAEAAAWKLRGLRYLSAAQAGAAAGVELEQPALLIPHAGWLSPVDYCRALLAACGGRIHCVFNTRVQLEQHPSGWQARCETGVVARAPIAILATAAPSALAIEDYVLPLESLRGAVSELPPGPQSKTLRLPLCHGGYLLPEIDGCHSIGAGFERDDPATEIQPRDHLGNLQTLSSHLPGLARRMGVQQLDPTALHGRVGRRQATPDHLPVIGACPDWSDYRIRFAHLRHGPTRAMTAAHYVSGLYLNLAHGAHGLTSAALAADMIAAQITGEAPLLDEALCHALHPARFLVRRLKRRRQAD